MKPRHFALCLIGLLLIDHYFAQFLAALFIGHYSFPDALQDAYRFFSVQGYLFFTGFRLIPYSVLISALIILNKSNRKNWIEPTFWGGFAGILAFMIWAMSEVFRPLYTNVHMSSTSAVAFIFIPLYSLAAAAAGMLIANGLYGAAKQLRKVYRDLG